MGSAAAQQMQMWATATAALMSRLLRRPQSKLGAEQQIVALPQAQCNKAAALHREVPAVMP